jgi:hypothetical protein
MVLTPEFATAKNRSLFGPLLRSMASHIDILLVLLILKDV